MWSLKLKQKKQVVYRQRVVFREVKKITAIRGPTLPRIWPPRFLLLVREN
jgi:hypothetical protein